MRSLRCGWWRRVSGWWDELKLLGKTAQRVGISCPVYQLAGAIDPSLQPKRLNMAANKAAITPSTPKMIETIASSIVEQQRPSSAGGWLIASGFIQAMDD
jgi:hypothetical protein